MIEYIFYEVSRKLIGEGIRPHAHPFWQVELMREGQILSTVSGLDYVEEPGDVLFIPPEAEHSLACKEMPSKLLIVKFRAEVAHLRPVHLKQTPLTKSLVTALTEFLPDPPRPVAKASREQTSLLLQVLFRHAYPPAKTPGRGLRERIDAFLARREGGYVTVEDIAREVGLSVSHTSRLFREEYQQSLKRYLDQKRADVSRALLRYSELTIAEIAQRQEFNDLSAFSRFVRSHHGKSPRELRGS